MNMAVRLKKIERHVVGRGRWEVILNCSRKTWKVGTFCENMVIHWRIHYKTKLNWKALTVEVSTRFIWPGRNLWQVCGNTEMDHRLGFWNRKMIWLAMAVKGLRNWTQQNNPMFIGPCIILITEESKNQLDATWYFVVLLIGSTRFKHYYAHHQELASMMLFTTLVVSFLVCCILDVSCS